MKYKQQFHDGTRTMEHQMSLLATNARELAEAVSKLLSQLESEDAKWGMMYPATLQEDTLRQMQATNRRLVETDIFMSGVDHERK